MIVEINNLIFRDFFMNRLNEADRKKVLQWLLDFRNNAQIRTWMQEDWELIANTDVESQLSSDEEIEMWQAVQLQIRQASQATEHDISPENTPKPRFLPVLKWTSIAAAIFIVLAVGITYFSRHQLPVVSIPAKDVQAPKTNEALLTLANGVQIPVNSVGLGRVVNQAGNKVLKPADDKLVYAPGNDFPSATAPVQYNTLTIPRGSKCMKLQLADGTMVWLNSGSSITFPLTFAKNRTVQLNGEAFFDVSHNASKPFYVTNNGFTVKVLGTKFNVNSYPDESEASVTLLEGSVDVETINDKKRLAPGQQLSIAPSRIFIDENINLDEVTAWRNNEFYFDGKSIRSIMKQVERYYDVQVEFKDEIPYRFVARISRDVPLSELLKKMELTNLVHFNITGKKVTIRK